MPNFHFSHSPIHGTGARRQSGQGTVVLNLSLFLMLLAFFLVMNGVSSFDEEKVYPVLSSVDSAFSLRPAKAYDVRPSAIPAEAQSYREGSTRERLERLFDSQIVGVRTETDPRSGEMIMDVPLDALRRAVFAIGQVDATLLPETQRAQNFFLPTLISLLRSEEEGAPYVMTLVFHSEPRKAGAMLGQAVPILEKLTASGLSPDLLNFALEAGDRDTVRIVFEYAGDGAVPEDEGASS